MSSTLKTMTELLAEAAGRSARQIERVRLERGGTIGDDEVRAIREACEQDARVEATRTGACGHRHHTFAGRAACLAAS